MNNKNVVYQTRICTYLWERITNMYFRMYIKHHNNLPNIIEPVIQAPVKLLENGQMI